MISSEGNGVGEMEGKEGIVKTVQASASEITPDGASSNGEALQDKAVKSETPDVAESRGL